MKIRKSFEQAICIMLLIATSSGSLKSSQLSQKLQVSDSYLKKITRNLVVAGLITSKASKQGGFQLNKNLEDITFLDIFNAVEGDESFVETTHLVEKVFDNSSNITETEDYIMNYLDEAEKKYRLKLKEISLAGIIKIAHK